MTARVIYFCLVKDFAFILRQTFGSHKLRSELNATHSNSPRLFRKGPRINLNLKKSLSQQNKILLVPPHLPETDGLMQQHGKWMQTLNVVGLIWNVISFVMAIHDKVLENDVTECVSVFPLSICRVNAGVLRRMQSTWMITTQNVLSLKVGGRDTSCFVACWEDIHRNLESAPHSEPLKTLATP